VLLLVVDARRQLQLGADPGGDQASG
jgi:hypothetical protein